MRSSILSRLGYFLLRSGVVLPRVDAVDRYYEQNHLRDLLRRLNINCLLDVGAYIGWFAKHLRMVGYDGHIVSFEPNRVSCDVLRENARGDGKWHVFNLALGSQDTTMPLNVIRTRAGTDLSSFLGATTFEVDGTETVNVRRLDSILGDVLPPLEEPRLFLKVDTQGFDVEVMRGAEHCMNLILGLHSEVSVRPIYDQMPHYLDALRYYESLGFSLMDLWVVSRTTSGSIVEYDCLMARLDKLASTHPRRLNRIRLEDHQVAVPAHNAVL